ncbi:hypothetical protein AUEXF2481DRAFT_217861 [Aureobasidium subglaciale EXF-2481]|uniref:Uncharacterized protein n=1 Tax=Aureobasidium subglaciale (strain EXF-2481) TaxID=1043005 RepID=A0A074Z9A1_AURSE|nr:uncharacterized protein AUEXF2481DRAFT_217861 [Aureobasidium subglaciale EXF-2481]KEQ95411.1 hypothetical protein AUEXF2481DRAFT_217861 [Aureobasidium subglaciale EXF-2481]
MQFTTLVALLASGVAVNAMPGGGGDGHGWSKTTSSCITKSTCSNTVYPWTSVYSKPETYVSTYVTSYPATTTATVPSTYTTTEISSQTGKSTTTGYSTYTESNVYSTYTTVSVLHI